MNFKEWLHTREAFNFWMRSGNINELAELAWDTAINEAAIVADEFMVSVDLVEAIKELRK